MIQIMNGAYDSNVVETQLNSPIQKNIYAIMQRSQTVYAYDSPGQLLFEIHLRESTIHAAIALYASNPEFAGFPKTRCNPAYWNLTPEGGFQLKPGILPSVALLDIYANGSLYAFECATAMLIVLYKAVLEQLGTTNFDRLFGDLYLYHWHYDRDLGLITQRGLPSLPGDIVYFENPDVDPEQIEWQGENAVDLGNGTYYGHGIGITGAEQMIQALNRHRKPGATRSAYLLNQTTHPDFQSLSPSRMFAARVGNTLYANR